MKKLLAITLSLLMVFSVIPMTMASAAGTYTAGTEAELLTAFADKTGANITLTADIVITSQISFTAGGKTYAIDTQGFDITYTNADPESTDACFKFTQTWANTLTFTNNTEDAVVFTNNSLGDWTTSVSNANTMKFVGSGVFTFNQTLTAPTTAIEIGVNNATTAPTFNANIEGASATVRHRNGVINGNINVGTFSGEVTNANTKTVTEMTVNGDITTTGAVTVKRNVLYTINGNITAGGSLTVQGATITAGKTVTGKNVCIMNQNTTTGKTIINTDVTATNAFLGIGGTVNGKVTTDKIIGMGGTYNDTLTATSGDIFGGSYATDPATLTGVTVHSTVTFEDPLYVVDTYKPVEIVSTGEKYASLSAAYNAAVAGDTIKLVDTLPHTGSGVLATIKKDNITIDLNGQTVTDFTDVVYNNTAHRFITVQGAAVPTFKLTSSNGKGKLILNGTSGGANQQIIRIETMNATDGANITLENFDIVVPSSGGEGNGGWRGFINISGTAVAENNVTIKNVTGLCNYTAGTGNVGYAGLEMSGKANYTIENCDFNAIWSNFYVSGSGSVVKVKDSTFGFQKSSNVTVATAAEVEFDNCIFEKDTLDKGVATIKVTGAGADVTVKNSKIYSGVEVTKAATVKFEDCTQDISKNFVNAFSLTTGGQTVTVKNHSINYSVKQQANNNYAAFVLTGADGANVTLNLDNVSINEAYRVFRATNAYNAISVSKLAFAKTSTSATFSANANANVTIADGQKVYADEALTEEIADFAWNTTKGQTLYIDGATTTTPEYTVTIDGEEVATVKEGETFTLPALEEGKYYVDYEVGQVITVTSDINIVTTSYTYDITVDGEVVATVAHGSTYTLPALEAGKYYVGVTETEFVVTSALSFTTATYEYDVTIDGTVAATVKYGETFTLPALEAGKYYVGYEAGQVITVTDFVAITTAIYEYDVTIDGTVVATLPYGSTYTLPALAEGKYYVDFNEGDEITVTGALEFTTATYTYDITIDGTVVATVAYGDTYVLPATADGKQYVGGYVAGQEFTVTGALEFTTQDIPTNADGYRTMYDWENGSTTGVSVVTVNKNEPSFSITEDYEMTDLIENSTKALLINGGYSANLLTDGKGYVRIAMTSDFTNNGTALKFAYNGARHSGNNRSYYGFEVDGVAYFVENTQWENRWINPVGKTYTTADGSASITITHENVNTIDAILIANTTGYAPECSRVDDILYSVETLHVVTIDGVEVKRVLDGQTYTLPALEAGKYYVGYEDVTEVVVSEDLNLTTATYEYDVTIDGVVAATVAYGDTFVLPAAPEGKQYVDGYVAGQEFTVTEALSFTTEDIPVVVPVVSVSTVAGAGVRFNEVTGLRFKATIDTTAVDEAVALGYTVTMGTLIAPADRFASYTDLTFEANENNYLDVVTTGYYNEENGIIAGSISNIREANWGRTFMARAYVKLTKDGETVIYYAEQENARSLKEVAISALDDDSVVYNSAQLDLLDKWSKAADWQA